MTFDAARRTAIAIGTKASLATRGPANAHLTAEELHEVYVTAALDALLAARSSTTCPVCDGNGEFCSGPYRGSGTVPGRSVLLDLVAEPFSLDVEYPTPPTLFVARELT